MPEDFSSYPVSVSEARAEKTSKAKDWTPRDALIDVLREIDSGRLNLTSVVISFTHKNVDGGDELFGYRTANKDVLVALGLLEVIKNRIMQP